MNLKPYPGYRDSRIKWIGEIPEGWEVRKIKHFSKLFTGSTPDSGNEKYWDGNITWVTPADLSVQQKFIKESKRTISHEGYINSGTDFVNVGAIILATRAPIGYPTIVGTKLCFNQGCKAFEIKKDIISDYAYYFLDAYIDVLISKGNTTTFGELSTYDLASFPLLKPPLPDQTTIISFLDKRTARFDALIEKDKRLIALLKEKRTALINHAVTKGLNPNAKMKRVTHDLIEKIPENWDILALKHIVSRKITDGPHETPDFLDKGIPFISAEAIKQDKIDFTKMRGYISEELHEIYCTKCKPKKDDVFLVKSGATTGNVAIVQSDEEFSIWSPLALIRSDKQKLLPKLLYYILLSDYFKKTVELSWSFGTQQNIGMGVIENLSIIVPEIKEQKILLEILGKQTSKIDKTIQEIEEKVKLLEEYKKSLIHHVVTGKVDVRKSEV